ncbi:M20 metallopeptidase family protein [Pseudoroseicyclus aestuarii]|uniref:Amidohydrolase n=1 Tax=Pseudoroseicyclus aestuarii TaxID=1795041 RepID=A0A318STT1_9RHOB|nr:M20 family metallopeptidase [Pseudoroseicyclus aestuarii]PYE84862.1 amidohydrolase [Pseudoroseicyclus aestuarii]
MTDDSSRMPAANDPSRVIEQVIEAATPRLVALRRDLHAHPETGFDTHRTAGVVAQGLEALGLSVQSGVGRTGVVAEIEGGAPGPCLILRADMDALPIEERTGLDYASTTPGQMHACGHDIHTSALLGAAEALVRIAPHLAGRVRLVFQPAEETLDSGAAAMIADGVAQGADMAVSFHNQPDLAAGELRLVRGSGTASSDEFSVTVTGKSGHAARPDQAADPIVGAAYMITQLQTIVSRRMRPADPLVLTVGQISGGFTENIIPDTCSFIGTVRCRTAATRDMAEAAFREICGSVARAQGLEAQVSYVRGVPPLVNDGGLLAQAERSFAAQFSAPPHIVPGEDFGSEDFAWFSEILPTLQFHVGSGQPGRDDRLHNSDYQPDERSIPTGATAMARLALDLLAPDRDDRAPSQTEAS